EWRSLLSDCGARQWAAVEPVASEPEMLENARRDIDQRGGPAADAGSKATTRNKQKRALLVASEPAMLAETGRILGFERVAHGAAVALNPVWIGALVGLHRDRDPGRRGGRQAGQGDVGTGKDAADPVLVLQEPRDLADERAVGL